MLTSIFTTPHLIVMESDNYKAVIMGKDSEDFGKARREATYVNQANLTLNCSAASSDSRTENVYDFPRAPSRRKNDKNRVAMKDVCLKSSHAVVLSAISLLLALLAVILALYYQPAPEGNPQLDELQNNVQNLNESYANLLINFNRLEQITMELSKNKTAAALNCWYAPGNGYQYRLTATTQPWMESRLVCLELGGALATTGLRSNKTLHKIVDNVVFPSSNRYVWIGLNDIVDEGSWLWTDGIESDSLNTFWNVDEPNDKNGEDCGLLYWRPSLNDYPCERRVAALCERKIN